MSARLDIYTAISDALSGIEEIKTVELHNSQFDNEATERPHQYPFCTIEFSDMAWDVTQQRAPVNTSVGNVTHQQQGLFLMTVHVGFQSLKDETLSFLDLDPILTKVYRSLNGLSGETFGVIKRVSEEQDIDHGSVIVWNMNFSVAAFECGVADEDLEDATDGGAITIGLEIDADLDIDNQIIRTGDGNE